MDTMMVIPVVRNGTEKSTTLLRSETIFSDVMEKSATPSIKSRGIPFHSFGFCYKTGDFMAMHIGDIKINTTH